MKEQKLYEILSVLLSGSPVTADFIARKTNMSNKTVRNHLPQVKDILQKFNLTLVSKPGCGYYMEGDCMDRLRLQHYLENRKRKVRSYQPSERVYCILYQLLRFDHAVRLSQLERLLYVSQSSLYLDLKKCEDFLGRYNLSVINDRKKGLYLAGDENGRRKALYHLIKEIRNLEYPLYNEQINAFIQECYGNHFINKTTIQLLHKFETQKNVKLAVKDFEYLRLMYFISIDRIKHGKNIKFNNDYNQLIYSLSMIEKMNTSQSVLHDQFHVEFSEDEILYLSSLFLTLNNTSLDFIKNIKLEQQTKQIIQQFGPIVYQCLPIKKKSEFEEGLFHHILTILKKRDFELDYSNLLLKQIKEEFALPYHLAKKLLPIIEKDIGIAVPEEEAVYVAMHIASAIEQSLEPLRVLFLYEHRYSELKYSVSLIEAHIKEVIIVDKMRYQDYDEKNNNQSYSAIFTTFPYHNDTIPVYQIPMIPNKSFINYLREDLRKKFVRQDFEHVF